MLYPLTGVEPKSNSAWGFRTHPVTGEKSKFHNGADLAAPQGTPVIAPADGTIKYVLNNDICGYGYVIQHDDDTRTGYCHLSRLDVKKGQRVRAGQQIGLSGGKKGTKGAGRSTGPHLHFIVYKRQGASWEDENTVRGTDKDWPTVDPMPFLEGGGISFNPFAYAKELWDWWWHEETPDPLEEARHGRSDPPPRSEVPTPPAPPTALPPPPVARPASASWRLDTSVGRQIRLTAHGRSHGPGVLPGGSYSVEVWNGQSWVAAGSVTLQGGHSYLLTVRGGRIQLLET